MEIRDRKKTLVEAMTDRFGDRGEPRFYRAPGRVDLMGSHTDYNQGLILAATVDRDIIAAARPRSGGVVNLYSLNMDLEVRVHTEGLKYDPAHGWANYAKGVIKELLDFGAPLPGLDLVVHGDIPIGGNLSSSAALEAVVCEAALGAAGHNLAPWEKVQLTRRAEYVFVGMPCGVMDQFTVIMGGRDSAVMLDCRTLNSEALPLDTGQAGLVVIDSRLGRELVSSKYSERVKECAAAVKALRKDNHEILSLRDASLADLEKNREDLGDVLYRRAFHVLSENQRVREAGKALMDNDRVALGQIMDRGYESCRDNYENSTPELDSLYTMARGKSGVLGARICGAGWGGCLLALVERAKIEEFSEELIEEYLSATGRAARVWTVTPTPGAGPL